MEHSEQDEQQRPTPTDPSDAKPDLAEVKEHLKDSGPSGDTDHVAEKAGEEREPGS